MHFKKTFYVWQCAHCEHRNKEVFNFHYNFPGQYNATWCCSSCGNENYIKLEFKVYPITDKKKADYYGRWY